MPDDELAHWKYTKREKVHGKWRYYYGEDTGQNNKNSTTSDVNSHKSVEGKTLAKNYISQNNNKTLKSLKETSESVKSFVSDMLSTARKETALNNLKNRIGDSFENTKDRKKDATTKTSAKTKTELAGKDRSIPKMSKQSRDIRRGRTSMR